MHSSPWNGATCPGPDVFVRTAICGSVEELGRNQCDLNYLPRKWSGSRAA